MGYKTKLSIRLSRRGLSVGRRAIDSGLSQSLIGMAPAAAAIFNQEKFRVALLSFCARYQFIIGCPEIDNLGLDSQDEEHTETTEQANVPSRYYCYQCRQVVSVTVDVEITCPLCHGGWIQEYGRANLLYVSVPSESKHSASDSDGQGTIPVNPSGQTSNSYGSDPTLNRSPFHITANGNSNVQISHASHAESHQATGHSDSSLEQGFLSVDANQQTRVTASDWIFSAIGLAIEALSSFFDQVSTPVTPQYSLYGMLLSITAVPVCIVDLIYNANALIQRERERELASASNILWGILPAIFGLALACIQCISSALQFSFLCRHAANPVKISLVPFLFFFVLFAFKYREGRN